MKILLDENIDIRMKYLFPMEYEIYTVKDMGWNGVKNGRILQLIAENNFDYWIVVDKNIPYQQNLKTLPCVIIIMNLLKNTLISIRPLMPELLLILKQPLLEKVIVINSK